MVKVRAGVYKKGRAVQSDKQNTEHVFHTQINLLKKVQTHCRSMELTHLLSLILAEYAVLDCTKLRLRHSLRWTRFEFWSL